MKTTTSIFSTNLTRNLRTIATVTALVMMGNLAIAQEPRPDRQGSGGGTTFNYGGIFNLLKNALGGNNTNSNAKQPPVLQKRAESVSAVSGGNYTVNWVVSYANTSGQTLPTAQVQDGPIATIIPGSLKQPTGWTGSTNTNSPINNWATWTGANVQPHGVMTATLPNSSVGSVNLGGSGDGFQPIPYTHSAGSRIYIMNHHNAPGVSLFDCVDLSSGGHCTGFPRTLPFGDGTTKSSGATSNNSEYVIDGSKFYYPAQNFAEWGIGCFDLENEMQCGYTPLGSSSIKANQTQLQGPWRVGNELYLADYTGQLYCAKLAAGLPSCLSAGYKIPLTDIKLTLPSKSGKPDSTVLDWFNGLIAGKLVGTRLYLTSRSVWFDDHNTKGLGPTPKYTNCFDTISKTACWATNSPTKGTGTHKYFDPYSINYSNFIYYSTSGTAQAICTKLDTPGIAVSYQACTDLNTGAVINLPRIFPNEVTRNTLSVHVWPRTYFTGVSASSFPNSGKGWCWDWSTANYCGGVSGAFTPAYAPATSEYGNNIDDNGCIWTYGHDNNLWGYDPSNIDPITKKAKPCGGEAGKTTKIFKPLEYCSGPKPFHWTGVEIKSATLSNFDKFIVKVLDSTTNAVLMTKDLKATNTTSVDTTSIDTLTLSKPFKIEVESTPKAGTSDKPSIEVRYDAPAPEFCFQSMHTCQQGKVTNNVEATDPIDPKKTVKAQAEVAQPQSCGVPQCVPCGTAGTPTCPPCGQAGQEPCPVCDCVIPPTECKPGSPLWPTCLPPKPECIAGSPDCPIVCQPGSPFWPTCLPTKPECIPGSPDCPIPTTGCIPGSPNCPTSTPLCKPGTPGWPLCQVAPPPPIGTPCLFGDCAPKAAVSIGEEYKEPKVACVRKPKPVAEEPKKVVAPKPRPKPLVVTAPVVVDPNAPPPPPKPKPKPRPKAVPAKPAAEDDC